MIFPVCGFFVHNSQIGVKRSKQKITQNCVKVAACFGAPLLNLLVGTGIGCTAAILSDPDRADGVMLDVSHSLCHIDYVS